MFTVCHVHLKPRRNWKFGKREEDEEKRSKVDVLACGFLPITTSSDSGCLIDNGLHNVKMAYSCRSLPPELADGHEGSMILKKLPEPRKPTDLVPTKSALTKSDEGDGSEKNGSETQLLDTDDYAESSVLESESAASDTYTDSEQGLHPKLVNATDLMNLQVSYGGIDRLFAFAVGSCSSSALYSCQNRCESLFIPLSILRVPP
jgi:hypothetical protein